MAIVGTHLSSAANATGVSSLTTSSVSPSSNALVIVAVGSFDGGGNPNTPSSVSGAGLTFDLITSRHSGSNVNQRMSVYRALSASPSSGGITVNFGSGTGRIFIMVDQFTGVDFTGTNGTNAVSQNASNDQNTTSTSFTITLTNPSASSAVYGAVYEDGSNTLTPGSNFTQLGSDSSSGLIYSEWAATSQTSVNWTYASAAFGLVGVALEIKALPSGGLLMENI